MQRSTIGLLLLCGLLLVAIGLGSVLWPMFKEHQQIATSDAAQSKGTIRVGVDNFVGYFPLCSDHMRQLMLADGWKLDCVQDAADYYDRFNRLKKGELEFAVSTVDSYVLAGKRLDYPGTIVSVIDESRGADAIVARSDAVHDLSDLRTKLNLKFAYTPDSPSHYFLKLVAARYDVPLLRQPGKEWRIETKGSSEACNKLLSGEAQVAVCWEPDITSTLSHGGMVKLIGSEQVAGAIVDVLVASREYHEKNPDQEKALLAAYFKTLKYYRDTPDSLRADAARYAGVSEQTAEVMVKGVRWATLHDNGSTYLGVNNGSGQLPAFKLLSAIEEAIKALVKAGDFVSNPLPHADPRFIINSSQVALLLANGFEQIVPGGASDIDGLAMRFSPLDENGWGRLKEVGTLRLEPIRFQSGSNALTLDDKKRLDELAEAIRSNTFRIEVQGHTRPGGDELANRALSQDRADAVARYLQVTYNIDPNRVHVVGFGSSKPLTQQPGEAYRAFQYRLSRVEVHLKTEVY